MASKIVNEPDNEDDILYVKRQKYSELVYGGYKREYLARNLSVMEKGFVICKVCIGITRNASLYKEETTCLVCSESPANLNHVKLVQTAVNQLEIKCPLLRKCDWSGKLYEAETHLETCQSFLIRCDGCGNVLSRRCLSDHLTNLCRLRDVVCVHCGKGGKAQLLEEHLKICDEFPIYCPNECSSQFPRKQLSQHRSECELEVVTCPYKEYGCRAESMLRRDLLAHKKENIVEHTDMSLVKMNSFQSEIKQLKDENACLENRLRLEGKTMKQLDGVELILRNIDTKIPGKEVDGPTFYINNYKLQVYLSFGRTFVKLYLKRIEGKFDEILGSGFISQYTYILVNIHDNANSYSETKPMDHELKLGEPSAWFISISKKDYVNYLTKENSLFVILYFELNSKTAQ